MRKLHFYLQMGSGWPVLTFYRLLGWFCINLTWTVALYNARLDHIPGREGSSYIKKRRNCKKKTLTEENHPDPLEVAIELKNLQMVRIIIHFTNFEQDFK